MIYSDPDQNIFEELVVDDRTKTLIVSYVRRRLASQPVKIRADIEVTCFTYEGIDAIKAGLSAGESKSVPEAPVVVKLIAPPMYVMTCVTLDKDLGIETLNRAIEYIGEVMRGKG
jgi:translation initiation factor 2 subunit 1